MGSDTMALWSFTFTIQGQDFEALLDHFEERALACSVIEHEDEGFWRAEILFEDPSPSLGELRKDISGLAALRGWTCWDWALNPVPVMDWLAQNRKDFPPVYVGRYGILRGHHPPSSEAEISLVLEAGTAFGSGTHESTQGCLKAMDGLCQQGKTYHHILDVGCGSGILAIAAAKTWPHAQIIASDCDPEAVRITQLNAARNGAGERIQTYVAEGLDHEALQGPFDLMLANLLLEPLQRLAPFFRKALAPQGKALLSGLLQDQRAVIEKAYQEQGLYIENEILAHPWMSLVVRVG